MAIEGRPAATSHWMLAGDVARIVNAARALVAAHERRSPTSQHATLGEEEAMDADAESRAASVDRSCVKCGSDDIRVAWHGKGAYHESRKVGFSTERCYSDYGPTLGKPKGEHLHYKCRTCGFDWTGVTADAKAAA